METLLILASIIAACSANAIPTIPGDNSHYVEGVSRYIWMPDREGKPLLVDLQASADEAALKSRNGADNQYWLYTRQNPYNHQILEHGNPNSIEASNYLGSRPLKVVVHGWNSNGNNLMSVLISSAFVDNQDANVIVVDWSTLANNPSYSTVSAGIPSVGQHLGNFLIWLIDTAGGNWDNVHLVGLGLGAHVVGIAGRMANGWPARVTGLDPAGPLWTSNSEALNANSGQYVEAIHTDGGILGIFHPIGDADFYPNGGKNPQPGCEIIGSICSHERAPEFFTSTIYYNHHVGRACLNIWEAEHSMCYGEVLNMGNAHISKRGIGIYGLHTGRQWPY